MEPSKKRAVRLFTLVIALTALANGLGSSIFSNYFNEVYHIDSIPVSYTHLDVYKRQVCAYAALAALLQLDTPERTAVCMLADKEEIGSEGVTGMKSASFDTFMADLCAAQGVLPRACYEKSFCLSADVTAAYDPNFADVRCV